METRLAKLEQAVADHLETCEKRATSTSFQLGCVRNTLTNIEEKLETQINVVEKKFDDRSWKIILSLFGALFLLLVTLLGYIWNDHTEDLKANVQAENLPRVYPPSIGR